MATGTIAHSINQSSNGYCKFPDGTLIQWGKLTLGSKTATSTGYMYIATYQTVKTFDIEFYSNDDLTVQISPSGGTYEIIAGMHIDRQKIHAIDVARPTSGDVAGNFTFLAVGRWKA